MAKPPNNGITILMGFPTCYICEFRLHYVTTTKTKSSKTVLLPIINAKTDLHKYNLL